ncbi:hypothetical protein ROHU_017543 [Labeo rohita]|uniref:Uncharacterized protein n=1 Tax=Labeo rohita TaxID=84645 RepID=A0A498NFQ8_LABRO|nr:hypothetical protein ROHU_017543 [Labeo rohita]
MLLASNWLTGDGSVRLRSRPGAACQPQSVRFSFGTEARGLLSLSEHLPSPPQSSPEDLINPTPSELSGLDEPTAKETREHDGKRACISKYDL